MAQLNRHALDLIRKSNKPENIQGIVNKGYAFDYAVFLAEKGDDLPQPIVDQLLKEIDPQYNFYKNSREGNKMRLTYLSAKMKEKGANVPKPFIDMISESPTFSEIYMLELFKSGLVEKIEPEVYEPIIGDGFKVKRFLGKLEAAGFGDTMAFPINVLYRMLGVLTIIGHEYYSSTKEDRPEVPYYCEDILDSLMRKKAITNFKQIPSSTLNFILKHRYAATSFANSLRFNQIKDLPKEVDDIMNAPKPAVYSFDNDLRKMVDALINYKKSTSKFQESFSSWFKKRY